MPDTYYEILGVSVTAEPGEIKAKYRKLIQEVHPDLEGSPGRFMRVQEAYEVLTDPVRRAAYDRGFRAPREPAEEPARDATPRRSGATASSRRPARLTEGPARGSFVRLSLLNRYVAFAVALVGAELLIVGVELGVIGSVLIGLGVVALIIALLAAVGGRGAREREAFRRSGMAAVDAMTGRQFTVLLQHFFADQGYRVARLGSRGGLGADLLIDTAQGRGIVQVRHGTGVVRSDAVQRAVVAMHRHRASAALLVTSSNYSEHAASVANSNGVKLWNRTALATELSGMRAPALQSGVERFSSDLRAGSRIFRGSLATAVADLVTAGPRARAQQANRRAS
jgi:curved DNA-binding protein CbpA